MRVAVGLDVDVAVQVLVGVGEKVGVKVRVEVLAAGVEVKVAVLVFVLVAVVVGVHVTVLVGGEQEDIYDTVAELALPPFHATWAALVTVTHVPAAIQSLRNPMVTDVQLPPPGNLG